MHIGNIAEKNEFVHLNNVTFLGHFPIKNKINIDLI